jgi:hypothetical protein
MSWFIVVITVALDFLLKGPRGLSGLTVLLRYGFYYLIYLVGMAILFFRYRDRLLFWRNVFCFLRFTPEIII